MSRISPLLRWSDDVPSLSFVMTFLVRSTSRRGRRRRLGAWAAMMIAGIFWGGKNSQPSKGPARFIVILIPKLNEQ